MVRIVLPAVLVGFLLSGCFLLPEEEKPLAPPDLLVEEGETRYETVEVTRADLVQEAKIHGRLTASEKADLFFRYQGGRLTKLNVKVDDRVEKGELIAELGVGNMEIQIQQREVLLEKAKLTQEMLEATKATKYQIALAALDVKLAELQLEDLRRSYDNLRLVSPIAGVVSWVDAEEGDYVEAFRPIVRVVNPARLVLECEAESSASTSFTRGAVVSVVIAGKDLTGTVIMTPDDALETARVTDGVGGVTPDVMPAYASSEKRSLILIDVRNLPRDAVLNDLGVATLTMARRPDAVVLPKDVINYFSGRSYVNVLRNGEIEERDVEVGLQLPTEVEILKGVEPGERVVRR